MANVFIHFEPIGPVGRELEYGTTDLPPYVIPGSLEEPNWRMRNPNGHTVMKAKVFTEGTTEAHRAASDGNHEELVEVIDSHEEYVNARDANGWTPLHEAVRRGKLESVQFLIDRGSDVNSRTNPTANGGSVLYWAWSYHPDENHPVIALLKKYGAKYFLPFQSEETFEYERPNLSEGEL
jgi:Ankyrin repeats (3 copies)